MLVTADTDKSSNGCGLWLNGYTYFNLRDQLQELKWDWNAFIMTFLYIHRCNKIWWSFDIGGVWILGSVAFTMQAAISVCPWTVSRKHPRVCYILFQNILASSLPESEKRALTKFPWVLSQQPLANHVPLQIIGLFSTWGLITSFQDHLEWECGRKTFHRSRAWSMFVLDQVQCITLPHNWISKNSRNWIS